MSVKINSPDKKNAVQHKSRVTRVLQCLLCFTMVFLCLWGYQITASGAVSGSGFCADGEHVFTGQGTCMMECIVCGLTQSDGDHSYGYEITQEATCGADGEITYTCSVCGDSYTETIPVTGHSFSYTYQNATTCLGTCSVCGSSGATAHDWITEEVDATCTEAAQTINTCSQCGHSDTTTSGSPKGHKNTLAFTDEATCTEAGANVYSCSVCGEYTSVSIPATGHSYANDFDIACEVCGEERAHSTLTIDPNGGNLATGSANALSLPCRVGYSEAIPDPARDGYTFVGWAHSGGGTWDASTSTFIFGDEDATLTAIWNAEDSGEVRTVSGVWMFYNIVTSNHYTGDNDFEAFSPYVQSVSFASNGASYGSMSHGYRFMGSASGGALPDEHCVSFGNSEVYRTSNGGWVSTAQQTVDFGPNEQTVSLEFYEWFTSNASPVYADYTVNHYQMDANGNYPDTPMETETCSGHAGTNVTPAVKVYEGFTSPETQTVTIAEDGSTVVNYYYARSGSGVEEIYTLTFDLDGGVWPDGTTDGTETGKPGDSIVGINTPSKDGFIFGGWVLTGGGEYSAEDNKYTFGNSDGTLTATWTAAGSTEETYTLTFDLDGGVWTDGTTDGTETGKPGDSIVGINTPSKDGFIFGGWVLTGGGEYSAEDNEYTFGHSDGTLTAIWKVTLTFDLDGGVWPDGTTDGTETGKPGDSIVGINTPSKDGYTFDGWTLSGGGEYSKEDNEYTFGDSDGILKANWVANSSGGDTEEPVTVTFDPQGGSVGTTSKRVTVGGIYGTLPTPTRDGYAFNGWYTSADGAGSKITASTTVTTAEDHTLYASWTYVGGGGSDSEGTVTVAFDPQGGSVSPTSKDVTVGEVYGELPVPTKDGYTFDGWYTEMDGQGSKVTASTTVTAAEDHTLYAAWTANIYTVTLNAQGGSVIPTSIDVIFGGFYGELPTPTKAGYTFRGWFTGPNGNGNQITGNTTVTIVGDHTLYAFWSQEEYALTIDPNGGSWGDIVVPQTVTGVYGDVLSPPVPTKDGFVFAGWALSGGGVYSAADNQYTFGDSDGILTATWQDANAVSGIVIDAVNRWFMLEDARRGMITLDELLSTASAIGAVEGSLTIIDYSPEDFIHFTASGSVTVTYRAEDGAGNKAYKTVTIYIFEEDAAIPITPSGSDNNIVVRFISYDYYLDSFGAFVIPEEGGLVSGSKWVTDNEYINALMAVLENRYANGKWDIEPVFSVTLDKGTIAAMKGFVETYGLGMQLDGFYDAFLKP